MNQNDPRFWGQPAPQAQPQQQQQQWGQPAPQAQQHAFAGQPAQAPAQNRPAPSADDLLALFGGVGGAKQGGGRVFFSPGNHIVKLVLHQAKPSEQDTHDDGSPVIVVFIDAEIISSTVHQPGEIRSQIIPCKGKRYKNAATGRNVALWEGNINNFACGLISALGGDPDAMEEQAIARAAARFFGGNGEEHAGTLLALRTWIKDTKGGGEYTVYDWSAPPQNVAPQSDGFVQPF